MNDEQIFLLSIFLYFFFLFSYLHHGYFYYHTNVCIVLNQKETLSGIIPRVKELKGLLKNRVEDSFFQQMKSSRFTSC